MTSARTRRTLVALAIPAVLASCTAIDDAADDDASSAVADQSTGDSPEVIAASLARVELVELLENGPTLDGSAQQPE